MLVIDKAEVAKDFKKRSEIQVFRLRGVHYDPELGRLKAPLSHTIPSKYATKNGDILKYVISTTETDKGKKQILGRVTFVEGELKVRPDQTDLLQFLDNCPWNGSNEKRDKTQKNIFNEYNPEQEKEDEFDWIQRKSDLIQSILVLEGEDLTKLARGFGINMNQKEKGMKADLLAIADGDPDRFEEKMHSPEMTIRALIAGARELKLIDLNKRVWHWKSESKGVSNMIMSFAKGKNPLEELTIYLMSPLEDPTEVRENLMEQVYGEKDESGKPE